MAEKWDFKCDESILKWSLVRISCSLFNLRVLVWCLLPLFGIKTSHLRLFCLRGVCFVTGYQRRIILFVVVWLLMRPVCVLLVAGLMRLQITYFCIVIFMVRFGTIFTGGWMFQRSFPCLWGIILFSLPLLVVLQGCINPFYRFFGLQHREKYRKKETIGSSMANNAQF